MARLRPGWLVVLCAAVLAVSAWLPWLTSRADGGGHANAIGGIVGNMPVPPPGFGVGQLITAAGVDVDRRGRDGRARPVGAGGINDGTGHFGAAGGADDVVLPALRVPAGVGGIRAVPRRIGSGVRDAAVGVGDARRVVGGEPGVMSGFVEPVTLTGNRWVTLEPLSREHIPEIKSAAADGELGSLWFTQHLGRTTPSSGSTGGWQCRSLTWA